ncbi:enoyl-CoA hydratase [Sphingobium lactosutens]|uniref:Enoyl-CoA hydratase n=1 Tax=Sphingobium lactosutens DS20 TaxID=1331060 RepID=T0HFM2_9SPHN|nr:enoyl-CoA hydratase [Sphingobium lactosutens]EQB11802.1 hypothetical protein RLDS_21990 [Sphingobium lactosutens DS20]
MMETGHLRLEQDGSIAQIIIDNPAKRNAMSLSMWEQLDSILADIGEDIRCIIVTGAGDKAFVSGADISEFQSARSGAADIRYYDQTAEAAMQRLFDMPQPTIAMISGYCIGGGVALALCCDVRIASDDSQFAVPAVRVGLGYGVTNLNKLVRVIGIAAARDIMLSGRRFDAEEALRLHLISKVVPREKLLAHVADYSAQMAANAPLTQRAIKATLNIFSRAVPSADLDQCDALAEQCFLSEDYQEGTRAYMEKRKPLFRGR